MQHGCPKQLMKSVGSVASITIAMDVTFADNAAKLKVLGLLCTNSDSTTDKTVDKFN